MHSYKFVEENILVGQKSYKIRFLERVKHDCIWLDEVLHCVHV
jgi:hypothetical protein